MDPGTLRHPYIMTSWHEQEVQWRLGKVTSFMVPTSGRKNKPEQPEDSVRSVAEVYIYCSLGASERNPGFLGSRNISLIASDI